MVKATTINRTDCGILWAKPWLVRILTGLFKPKHSITGTDFSGIVEEVGAEVMNFKIGDHVRGFNDDGSMQSHAEYLVVPEGQTIDFFPENIDFHQAAASVEASHYAYHFIKKLKISQGDRILVNGGTGAIGSALIQFLIAKGVEVTATCRREHFDILKDLGVKYLINYESEDFTQMEVIYNHVFDAVGKSTFGKCKGHYRKWRDVRVQRTRPVESKCDSPSPNIPLFEKESDLSHPTSI